MERRVCRNKKYNNRKWREDCRARIFSLFRQRLQSKQEELEGEEEMKHQQRIAIMKDLLMNIRSKESMDVKNRWGRGAVCEGL